MSWRVETGSSGYVEVTKWSGFAAVVYCVHADQRVLIATPLDSPVSLFCCSFLVIAIWCCRASSEGSALSSFGQLSVALGENGVLAVGRAVGRRDVAQAL